MEKYVEVKQEIKRLQMNEREPKNGKTENCIQYLETTDYSKNLLEVSKIRTTGIIVCRGGVLIGGGGGEGAAGGDEM